MDYSVPALPRCAKLTELVVAYWRQRHLNSLYHAWEILAYGEHMDINPS